MRAGLIGGLSSAWVQCCDQRERGRVVKSWSSKGECNRGREVPAYTACRRWSSTVFVSYWLDYFTLEKKGLLATKNVTSWSLKIGNKKTWILYHRESWRQHWDWSIITSQCASTSTSANSSLMRKSCILPAWQWVRGRLCLLCSGPDGDGTRWWEGRRHQTGTAPAPNRLWGSSAGSHGGRAVTIWSRLPLSDRGEAVSGDALIISNGGQCVLSPAMVVCLALNEHWDAYGEYGGPIVMQKTVVSQCVVFCFSACLAHQLTVYGFVNQMR